MLGRPSDHLDDVISVIGPTADATDFHGLAKTVDERIPFRVDMLEDGFQRIIHGPESTEAIVLSVFCPLIYLIYTLARQF